MAQGNCHGVGGIVGLGHGGQIQNPLGHVHDLMLGGVAVANHGLLDLHGFIFINRDARLLDSQKNNPSGLSDLDACGYVVAEEQFFDGHSVGPGQLHELCHIVVDFSKAPIEVRIGGRGDGAAAQQAAGAPLGFNDAEARNAIARVDAQNAHYSPPPAMVMS